MNVTQENDPGVCQAAVAVPPLTATDNCGVASVFNNFNGTADASDVYPVGTTNVLWTVTDTHGNVSTCSMSVIINDAEGPSVQFVSTPPNPGNKTSPRFDWQGVDDNNCTLFEDLQFSTNLDGSGWSSWSSVLSETPGPLTEGEHTFEVCAKDEAGNVGATTSYTWLIDLTPPIITLTVPAAQAVYLYGSEILADWSVSDNEPGVALSISATCASGVAIDAVTAGTRLFFVEVTDSAGNAARIEANYRIAYVVRGVQPSGNAEGGESDEAACYLDKSIASAGTSLEETPLVATYELGEPIGIAATVTDANGDSIAGAICTVTVVGTAFRAGEAYYSIVGYFILPYVSDLGIYAIDIATPGDGWLPEVGYYDLWLDLDDETHIRQRIEIIEPMG